MANYNYTDTECLEQMITNQIVYWTEINCQMQLQTTEHKFNIP